MWPRAWAAAPEELPVPADVVMGTSTLAVGGRSEACKVLREACSSPRTAADTCVAGTVSDTGIRWRACTAEEEGACVVEAHDGVEEGRDGVGC